MITGNEPAMPMQDVAFHAKNNDVAFGSSNSDFNANFKGLTIRQHFAAMAMQGFLSNSEYYKEFISGKYSEEELLKACIKSADALIAELNKPNN